MIILLHIVTALLSLIVTALTALKPTRAKLRASAALIALTLISGTVLAVLDHQLIARVCTTGLVYLVIESAAAAYAVRTFRRQAEGNIA